MNLGKSVYNLLKRQSEVYVIGLGTFKRNHTPSTFDEKRNVYLPPIDYIDFESNSETGYDFISYIQQLDEIERSHAKNQVEQTVGDLLEKVRDQGQVKLDDLGYLVSYGEGYVFKALDLSGFNYEPVEALDDFIAQEPETGNKVVEIPAQGATADLDVEAMDEQDSIEVSSENEVLYDEKPKNNTIWYVVIAIVALGILAVLYFRNMGNTGMTPGTDTSTKEVEQSKSVAVGDSIAVVAPTDSLQQKDSSETHAREVLIPANHTWQIVIGSHRTLAQAYEQAESYNKAGYPKVRVVPSNLAKNRKKVIWDSYETKAEIDSALSYVQKHIIKDAWPDKIVR